MTQILSLWKKDQGCLKITGSCPSVFPLCFPAVAVNYGSLVNTVVNFLIIAFAIFMVIKAMNFAKKKEETAPVALLAPSAEEKILTEIRDILSSK